MHSSCDERRSATNNKSDVENVTPTETGTGRRQFTHFSVALRRRGTDFLRRTALPLTWITTFVFAMSPLPEPAWRALAGRLQRRGAHILEARVLPGVNASMYTATFSVVMVLGLFLFPRKRTNWLAVSVVLCAAVGVAVRARNLNAFDAVASFAQLILISEIAVLTATAASVAVRRRDRTGDAPSNGTGSV